MGYRLLLMLVCAGCGFPGATADGMQDDDDDDGPLPGQAEIMDVDFESGYLISTDYAEPGVLEPAAYAVDGLRSRSYQGYDKEGRAFFILETESWTAVEGRIGEPKGTAYYRFADSLNRDNPAPNLGVGAIDQNNFIQLFDGEIRVTPGQHVIGVDPDDVIIVEIGPPDGLLVDLHARIAEEPKTAPLTVPEGVEWLPIRIALEDGDGGSYATLTVDGMLVGPEQLRAHINNHRGVQVRAGRDYYTARGESVVQDLDDDFNNGEPPLFPDTGMDRFGLRYVGQILIEDEGAYEFHARVHNVMDDSARVRIDGTVAARTWYGQTDPTITTELAAGWHDFVVDFADASGMAALHVEMRRAGETEFKDIPPATLRPVAAVGLDKLAYDGVFSADLLADGTPVTTMVDPMVPPDAIIEWQDFLVSIEPKTTDGVTVSIEDCAIHPFELRDLTGQFHEGGESCRDQHPAPARFSFSANRAGFTVSKVGVASSYHGGSYRPPYAAQAIFESRELDTAGTTGLVSLEISGDARDGKLRGFVRSGPELKTAEWIEVGADGVVPTGTPFGDRSQYRIVMETGGWDRITVDSVTLTYAKP